MYLSIVIVGVVGYFLILSVKVTIIRTFKYIMFVELQSGGDA